MLFGLNPTLELQTLIALGYLIFFFTLNYFSLKLGGRFQNISTIMKLIPLIGIGLIGIFWKAPVPVTSETLVVPLSQVGWGFLAALPATAFSFDGWVVATSITHEVKDAKRNMPIALTIGPLLVLVVYLAYFLGMVAIVGPEYILEHRDNTIYQIGQILFGEQGGTLILSFILIAVLGVVNGLVLGVLRMPQAMALKGMLPKSERIKVINEKTQLSPSAAKLSILVSLSWLLIHYLTQKFGFLSGGDISEIAIVFSYITYISLYLKVFKLSKNKVVPLLGILGSLIIVGGGIISNPTFVPLFLLACSIIFYCGYAYMKKAQTIK